MSWSRRTRLVALLVALFGCGGTAAVADGGADGGAESGAVAPAIQIACGFWRACVLRGDGRVECWGDAVPDMPKGPFTKIAAGVPVCGLRSTGDMECWGWGTFDGKAQPGRFVDISISNQRGCTTDTDGSVACWAWNGGGGTLTEPPPVPVKGVVAGDSPCGIRAVDAYPVCWGAGAPAAGLIPQGPALTVTSSNGFACAIMLPDRTIQCVGNGTGGTLMSPSGAFDAVKSNAASVCARRPDGTLSCWGAFGSKAEPITPSGTFADFCVGNAYGCGIHTDGSLACWGYETHGQTLPPPR